MFRKQYQQCSTVLVPTLFLYWQLIYLGSQSSKKGPGVSTIQVTIVGPRQLLSVHVSEIQNSTLQQQQATMYTANIIQTIANLYHIFASSSIEKRCFITPPSEFLLKLA
mmetsp:Transcript_21843/g.49018  ORF Transcript_21843/g.49018 Transcript_21843/m.49018 type:complete len:109 (+) Transcript_21843:529-855(+)